MQKKQSTTVIRRSILSSLISLSVLPAAQLMAQEEGAESGITEEVITFGVRRSLETALDIKRDASAIVDHISAEDISSVAALDLGEALQAIPGVQLNIEGSRRESGINLRGLPGGYIRTSANGHSFATPSNSSSQNGVSNPFGAFEASIFKGVTVYKSGQADLDEGYIAGVIDKKLIQALDREADELSVSLGSQYEQLNDTYDTKFNLRGTKILIEDTLAVTGAFAWSDQNFRRDLLRFNRYQLLDRGFYPEIEQYKQDNAIGVNDEIFFPSEVRQQVEISKGDRRSYAFNIQWQPNDELKLGLDLLGTKKDLGDARQDIAILGLRNVSNLRQEGVFENPDDPNDMTLLRERIGVNLVTPNVAPSFGFSRTEEGEVINTYFINDLNFDNGRYFPGTREWTQLQQTDGAFLTLEWERDQWKVESKLTTSDASSDTQTIQFDARLNPARVPGNTLGPNGERPSNGLMGRLNTGAGDLSQYVLNFTGYEGLDLDTDTWRDNRNSGQRADPLQGIIRLTANGLVNADSPVVNAPLNFFADAGEQFVTRGLDAFATDVQFTLDDNTFFSSIKGGIKFTRETFENEQAEHVAAFINYTGFSNELLIDPLYTSGTDFFNGQAPGAFRQNGGWVSIDVPVTIERLQRGPVYTGTFADGTREVAVDANGNPVMHSIVDDYNAFYEAGLAQLNQELAALQTVAGAMPTDAQRNDIQQKEADIQEFMNYSQPLLTRGGFVRGRGPSQDALFYNSQQDVTSIYVMTNFESMIADTLPISGNFGVRYAYTELETEGFVVQGGELLASNPKNDYDHILPSFNLTMAFRQDLLFRTAAYKGIVRPNIAFFRPGAAVTVRDQSIQIKESETDVKPYEADSLDFSLEWYNRAGSAVSVGLFAKWVENGFAEEEPCPLDGGDYGFGELFVDGSGDCRQVSEYTFERFDANQGADGAFVEETVNREVNISRTVNTDEQGKLRGFEAAIQQNLDFLPGFWSGFGGVINYSYVDTGDSRILTGISEESYNLIGYWENDWFSTRLSYNWRSEYKLQSSSRFTDNGVRTVAPRDRLDLSVSAEIFEDTQLTFRAYNLTDYIYEEYEGSNSSVPKRYHYDGRTYSLSLSYKFF